MKINAEDLMILITIGSGFFAVISFFWCVGLAFKLRSVRKRADRLTEIIEEEMGAVSRNLETVLTQSADQTRRVAWLETRVRPSAPAARQKVNEPLAQPSKTSLTEYRHRVLALAQRGLDVNTIANMLGEMPGEIELIINLHRAA